ncbi:hypothetical protein TVAG_493060 [Trichomonas vaginalis G3]|uniref:Uncharacterized protein n=1 Tax=Trichomonas vaginalis (strain ATCC PRA-98 / G3) TaxID=412133 RepID=A2F2B4_TRIV3|nr:hypothetical protein TVAGG3_0232690 [Trichomonas vaginalis G3]EAY00933.1 hypothetical protein TVAG_493060 [Trichomonas vaginalis G3]KAI5552762.1 hypothetical protein TVAGG3_0232690 [Trichomonas vaginalis G3]|eukprot:XP_001313862.1 hypothetical protein [Trichomonas vaginalis G3]
MTDNDFSQVLEKYSNYLGTPHDKKALLALGTRLFGTQSNQPIEKPSYSLLKRKEAELIIKEEKTEPIIKSIHQVHGHARVEQPQQQTTSPDLVSEELLILSDKNALLLARQKRLEFQRDQMLHSYGDLMEQSVQRKVQLKLDMNKLKEELNEALLRSRPQEQQTNDQSSQQEKRPIMDELRDLNSQVLMRIGSFKMSLSKSNAFTEKVVLDRYNPHMEKLLGEIYSYSTYLPVNEVIDKFNQEADKVEHETRDIETQLKSEHERNLQLQKEAELLSKDVKEQETIVTLLKQKNAQLTKEIELLQQIGDEEINNMNVAFKSLLDNENDLMGLPLSARATVVTPATQPMRLKRSVSKKKLVTREKAKPKVPSVDEFVEQMKSILLEKINHSQ